MVIVAVFWSSFVGLSGRALAIASLALAWAVLNVWAYIFSVVVL